MHRRRLKGGHRVGIDPNSTSYQPIASRNQQFSSDQQWTHQPADWSQPSAHHGFIDPSPSQNTSIHEHDSSWNWDSSTTADEAFSTANQPSYQGLATNYAQNNASSTVTQDWASPCNINNSNSSTLVLQYSASPHVANLQTASASIKTTPNENFTNNFNSYDNKKNDNTQPQSVDEWGWNDDNWDELANGEGKSTSSNTNTNNNILVPFTQHSAVSSGNIFEEFPQSLSHTDSQRHLNSQSNSEISQHIGLNKNPIQENLQTSEQLWYNGHHQDQLVSDKIGSNTSSDIQSENCKTSVIEDHLLPQFLSREFSNSFSKQSQQINLNDNSTSIYPNSHDFHEGNTKQFEHNEPFNQIDCFNKSVNFNASFPLEKATINESLQFPTSILDFDHEGIYFEKPSKDSQNISDCNLKLEKKIKEAKNETDENLKLLSMVEQLSLITNENKILDQSHHEFTDRVPLVISKSITDQPKTNSKYLQNQEKNNMLLNFQSNLEQEDQLLQMHKDVNDFNNEYLDKHRTSDMDLMHESQLPIDENRNSAGIQSGISIDDQCTEISNDPLIKKKFQLDTKLNEQFLDHMPMLSASSHGVASWDDEWSDGWDKPQDNVEQGEKQHYYKNSSKENESNNHKKVIQEVEDDKTSINNLPEVTNIYVLNQELQGIFSSPSDTTLVMSSYSSDETYNHKTSFSIDDSKKGTDPKFNNEQEVFMNNERQGIHEGDLLECEKSSAECDILSLESSEKTIKNLLQDKDAIGTSNFENEQEQEHVYKRQMADDYDQYNEHTNFENLFNKNELLHSSNDSSITQLSQPSSHSSIISQPQRPLSNFSSSHASLNDSPLTQHIYQHTMPDDICLETDSEKSLIDISNYENKCIISSEPERPQKAVSPSPMGPIGNISNLQARKGSPFQPPASRRYVSPQISSQSHGNCGISMDSPQAPVFQDSTKSQILQLSNTSHEISNNNSLLVETVENSLIANSQAPEQSVKLSVASASTEVLLHQEFPVKLEILPNTVPVLIPSEINLALDKFEKVATNNASKAYQSNLLKLKKAKGPSSPGTLDLNNILIKKEEHSASESDIPSFSRMVPGESTKGESTVAVTYHPPTIVPEMPSERVVTGNAYPQPIPTSRIKQEPCDVRSPPDGPDTADNHNDKTSSVIPPVRSETIGSEDMVVRTIPSDRRDERISKGRKERNSWDRDSYENRHHYEKKREGRDRYRDESPYGRHLNDRDYDSHIADGYYRRKDTDDDDDDDDIHEKYVEIKKERRNRAYRDELDRYNDKERDFQYHRRRNYHVGHEEEDPYYEGRSDRSRPSSRSSGYANLAGDGNQDYYERSHRYRKDSNPRDKERDFKERERCLRESEQPYRDLRMKDPRDPYMSGYPYPDQYAARGGYDQQQAYYYWYQNYYKDYYRQLYGSRYGYATGESMADDKASTRSGRSSVNDDMKKSSLSSMAPYDPYGAYGEHHRQSHVSSHFRPDYLEQSTNIESFESTALYPQHVPYGLMDPYASGDISGIPSVADDCSSDVQQRLSPLLFGGPHLSASFTPGGKFLLVLPNDPKQGEKPKVQIRNFQKMLTIDKDFSERIQKIKAYPGPLTVKETHKDVVIRFCDQKAAEALGNKNLTDQDSVVLFWEYLAFLVKQNGKVCGADLASLLMKGREVRPVIESSTNSPLDDRPNQNIIDTVPPEEATNSDNQDTKAELVKLFTEHLCLGRKKEAVDFAIKEGLWGYAMTLAAKMDLATHTATHTRVMSAFIQSIPRTHVLQTLFQHLSGKRPEVSKTYSADRWGDWRMHLAMMVSNPTGQLQRDRASIFAFGDTLAAKGQLHAAHLCYLAGEADWGTFSNKESKLVLIGASHHEQFQTFASDDAIQCTEIFEYAKSLDGSSQMLNNFQSYKLVYALRLAEAGFPSEALKYCEVISQMIVKDLEAYRLEFVSQVLDLATQLKYHDVHYLMGEGEAREMPDPEWLQSLQNALYTLQYQASQRELQNTPPEQVLKVEQNAYECTNLTPEPTYPTYNTGPQSQANTNNTSLGFNPNENDGHPESTYLENSSYVNGNVQDYNTEVPLIPSQEVQYEEQMQASLPYDGSLVNDGVINESSMMNNSEPPSMEYYGNSDNQHLNQTWNNQQPSWQTSQEQSQWQNNVNAPPSWQQENTHQSSHYPPSPDVVDSGSPPVLNQNVTRDAEEEEYWAMMSKKAANMNKDVPFEKMLNAVPRRANSRRVTFNPSHTIKYTQSYKEKIPFAKQEANRRKKIIQAASQRSGEAMLLRGNRNLSHPYYSRPNGFDDYEKGITKSNLIFGGSFPIDAPISARHFGTNPSTRLGKTFQVDAVCCSPPNLCPEHDICKRKTTSTCSTYVSRHKGPSITKMTKQEDFYTLTYPVDGILENGISSCLEGDYDEDDEFIDSEYQEEEYDEFGGDKYEYYLEEDSDDIDIDYEAGYSREKESSRAGLTHRIPHSSTHVCRPLSVSSARIPSPPLSLFKKSPPIMANTFHESRKGASIPHQSTHSNTAICPQPPIVPEILSESSSSNNAEKNPNEEISSNTDNLPKIPVQGGNTDTPAAPPTLQTDSKPSEDDLGSKKKADVANNDDKLDDKKTSGFLGSIFGWRKTSTNQAKLPDDKNPSIVWDEQKKKWVNVDGDDVDESAPPPPPSNLAAPPNIASFRGGFKKSRYVDPVGEKGRTKPPASTMPPPLPNTSQIQPAAFGKQMEPANFLPQSSDSQPQSNTGPVNEIQMRRNRYVSESSSVDLSDDWDPLSQDFQGDVSTIPMMGPPESQGQPMFFNPAQMKSTQPASHSKRSGPSRRMFTSPR